MDFSDNWADAIIILNTAIAYQLKEFKAAVDRLIADGHGKESAIFTILMEYIAVFVTIRFGKWIQ